MRHRMASTYAMSGTEKIRRARRKEDTCISQGRERTKASQGLERTRAKEKVTVP